MDTERRRGEDMVVDERLIPVKVEKEPKPSSDQEETPRNEPDTDAVISNPLDWLPFGF